MARICAVFVAVALGVGALTGCGSDDDSSSAGSAGDAKPKASAPAGLASDKELVTCMDVAFPPMEYYEGSDKTPTGFDVDLASAVAAEWGVEAVFKNTQFDGLLPALGSGRCDVVWSGIFVTEERTKTFPAISYYKSARVLLVPADNPDAIQTPEDLAGKTVATQAGTEYVKALNELAAKLEANGDQPPKIQTYPKMTEAIQQLVVGRADAVLTQDTEAAYRDKTQPGEFEVGYSYPATDTFGVYYTKANQELGDAIEQALDRLRDDGTLKELAEQYGLPASGLRIE